MRAVALDGVPCQIGEPRRQEVEREEREPEPRLRVLAHQVEPVAGGVVVLEGRHPAAAARRALHVVDDRLGVVAEAEAGGEGVSEPVGLLVVHEEALVQQADLAEGGRGHQRAAEAGRLEVAGAVRRRAVGLAVEGATEQAEAPVEVAGVGADEAGVVVVEDLGHGDGAVVGEGDELREEVRRQDGVVVEDEEAVEAFVEAVADADVVAAGGAQVLRGAQEDGVRQEALELIAGAVGRGVVDDDDAALRVVDGCQRVGEGADEGGAVVVDDDDAHGRALRVGRFGHVECILPSTGRKLQARSGRSN